MGFYTVVFRQSLYPLIIIIVAPQVAIVLPYIIVHKNSNLLNTLIREPLLTVLSDAWQSVRWKSIEFPLIIGTMLFWGTVSIIALGGEVYFGPKAMSGYRPVYFNSGFRFYVASMLIATPVIVYFSMLPIYYNFVTFAAYLIIVGFLASIFLFFKGRYAPSPGVFRKTRNWIFDFYWGVELYPRITEEIDLKQLVVFRFGLLLWQLIVIGAWKANFELYQASYLKGDINWAMTASTIMQSVYLAKCFFLEDAYMRSITMAIDHFGFYTAWGSIAFIPTFYASSSLYLVKQSPIANFGPLKFLIAIIFGLAMIYLNYLTDFQKHLARCTKGKCSFGSKPVRVIHAVYGDEDFKPKHTIILASGFWAFARHMNYTFELGAALAWSLTSANKSIVPYLYFIYLFFTLVHRCYRDEDRCKEKYGKFWNEYKKMVPYRFMPSVY